MTHDEKIKAYCTTCKRDLGYSKHETCLLCRQKPCKRSGCKTMTATKSGRCHLHGKNRPKDLSLETGAYLVENTVTGLVYPIGEKK